MIAAYVMGLSEEQSKITSATLNPVGNEDSVLFQNLSQRGKSDNF